MKSKAKEILVLCANAEHQALSATSLFFSAPIAQALAYSMRNESALIPPYETH